MNKETLTDIRKKLQPAPGIVTAYGMQGPLDWENSQWRFKMTVRNYYSDLRLILLTGGIPHTRIYQVTDNGSGPVYADVFGNEHVETTAPRDTHILIPDDPTKINQQTGINGTVVATNFKHLGMTEHQIMLLNTVPNVNWLKLDTLQNPGTIDELREYVAQRPLLLKQIQVSSNNSDQLSQQIVYGYFNPLQKFQENTIEFSNYYKPSTVIKKIEINKDIYIDKSLLMAIDILNYSEVDITFVFDSEFSPAKYMQSKQRVEYFFHHQ